MKKRRLKKFWVDFLLIVFILITIRGIYRLLDWNSDNLDTSLIIDEINEEVEINEKKDDDNIKLIEENDEEEEVISDYLYYIKFPLIDVDISKLKKKNSDTVGWINVNNTNVNYPFVQYTDNNFYLDHSFDKSYNEAGWVFMDYRNNSDLNNKNTILYAHSRLDKTMFGSLNVVLKPEWYFDISNHVIRISTTNENSLWQIFSVYKIEEESYYITTYFDNDDEYEKFLDTIKGRSIYNFNVNLNNKDKILTLSTCYSDTVRIVVHARLIKKDINDN